MALEKEVRIRNARDSRVSPFLFVSKITCSGATVRLNFESRTVDLSGIGQEELRVLEKERSARSQWCQSALVRERVVGSIAA